VEPGRWPSSGKARQGPGFQETFGGAGLELGTYRYIRAWIVGVAGFLAVAVFFFLLMIGFQSEAASSGPSLLIAFGVSIGMFTVTAGALATAIALRLGTWSLIVDEVGMHMVRGRHRPRDIPWARITRIHFGPVAVRVSRYQSELAEGLYVELRSRGTVRVDTARFRVAAADLDRIIAVVRDAAARHAVGVEPFPMMGRERP
jgi:hypothetical protein